MHELKQLLLQAPRYTLAVAESLTAGHMQARISAVSGASAYFRGGITAYSIDAKVALLGVDRSAAEQSHGVSAAVAEQMARGACRMFDADVGLATTGFAERSVEPPVPSPFAWWALAARSKNGFELRHGRIECPGATRVQAQAIVADAALAELMAFLRGRRS